MADRASITFKGTEEILKNLQLHRAEILQAAMEAVNDGLKIIEEGMKKDCPVNTDPKDTDTVHLRESIKIIQPAKKYKTKIVGRVGPTKRTAMHVEFGTSNMLPRVFMRTQIYKHKNDIRSNARRKIKEALGL